MLAFSAGAEAEPNPKASTAQSPSPADIKPGSLELDTTAPATDTGVPSTGLGSSRPTWNINDQAPPSAATAPSAPTAPTTGTAPSTPSTPPKAKVATPEPTGNGSQILVNVDKSTQEMTVFVDGVERHTWPVSTGTSGYATPSGNYTASSMNEIWYSKQWDDAPMPHSIFFTKRGHAIHATTEVKRLGRPASHGCVRLAPANAKTLFYLVKEAGLENTQVVLTGTTPGGEGPAVASRTPPKQIRPPRGYNPWFEQPPPQYVEPRRRGLFGFGRRNRNNAQGFNAPRYQQAPRYQPPRGLAPRGGFGY